SVTDAAMEEDPIPQIHNPAIMREPTLTIPQQAIASVKSKLWSKEEGEAGKIHAIHTILMRF
ncbi:MAG: hypothetical protein RLZZ224_1627, partial [Verrucomicrobiota bacterium]